MLTRHAYSAFFSFRDHSGEAFDNLVAHIQANGLLNPVQLYEGQILDGWNRYQACLAGGVDVEVNNFLGDADQAWQYAVGVNIIARERGLTAQEVAAIYLAKAAFDKVDDIIHPAKSNREIAKELGVSKQTGQLIATIEKANDPALVEAVASKQVSLVEAAALAKLPKEERATALLEKKPKKKKKKSKAKKEPAPDESESLQQELADAKHMLNLLTEDNERLTRIVEAADIEQGIKAELAQAVEANRVLTARNNGLMSELAGMTRTAKMWKGKLDNAETELKKYADRPF